MTHPASAALPLPRAPRFLFQVAAPRPAPRHAAAAARPTPRRPTRATRLATTPRRRRPLDVVFNEALRAAFLGLGFAWAAAEIALAWGGF